MSREKRIAREFNVEELNILLQAEKIKTSKYRCLVIDYEITNVTKEELETVERELQIVKNDLFYKEKELQEQKVLMRTLLKELSKERRNNQYLKYSLQECEGLRKEEANFSSLVTAKSGSSVRITKDELLHSDVVNNINVNTNIAVDKDLPQSYAAKSLGRYLDEINK